jgi:predicted PurR-regulated permease PerM
MAVALCGRQGYRGRRNSANARRTAMEKNDRWLALALRATLLGLFVWMVKGILIPIALGGLFALLLYPIEARLWRRFGKHGGLIPLGLTLGSLVLVVLPLLLLSMRFASALDDFLRRDWTETAPRIQRFVDEKLIAYGKDLHVDADKLRESTESLVRQIGGGLANLVTGAATAVPGYLIDLFLFIIALYYFLRDGRRLARWLTRLSPFDPPDTEELFASIRETVNGAILGLIVTAGVQGALTTLALYICQVPGALVFGVMATLLALFIPMMGTAPVTIGAIIYLVIVQRTGAAIGMAIAAVIIGLSDNVIRPWVQSSSTKMHPLLVMLGIFGGLEMWGAAGIFIGPIVAAMAVWTIDTYVHLRDRAQKRSIPPRAPNATDPPRSEA